MSLKIKVVKASGAALLEGLCGGVNSSPNHPARRCRALGGLFRGRSGARHYRRRDPH
ncbi:MAG: hypothetical protein ACLQVM_24755 [Terriglobia bacterium]